MATFRVETKFGQDLRQIEAENASLRRINANNESQRVFELEAEVARLREHMSSMMPIAGNPLKPQPSQGLSAKRHSHRGQAMKPNQADRDAAAGILRWFCEAPGYVAELLDGKHEGDGILLIIARHRHEAVEADRRGRTFSPTELDLARQEAELRGIKLGLEAAIKAACGTNADLSASPGAAYRTILYTIRAIDPADVQRGHADADQV